MTGPTTATKAGTRGPFKMPGGGGGQVPIRATGVHLVMLKFAGVALLLAAAVAADLSAQSGTATVRGLVRDQQGGSIAGAVVDVQCGSLRRRGATNPSGEFVEAGLPATRCHVSAWSDDFEAESVTVDAAAGGPANLVLHVRRFASEVVVTPTRGVENSAFDLPEAISVTSRRDIDRRPYTLFSQVLREEPGVLVQQTTSAQVSPIIRGFTGQGNVYLVDGVRLNTSAWRAGPSQYFAWISGGPVDSIEVVRGGGSVQYGSDALGGTVQVLTTPVTVSSAPRRALASVEFGGGTADRTVYGQGDLGIALRRATVRVGAGAREVGDLRAGGGLDSHAAVTRYLGLPSSVLGSRQLATSFEQRGGYAVADVGVGTGGIVHALYMHESQIGASRYDRLMGGEGLFRSGFEPQTLDLAMARYSTASARLFDGVSMSASLNRQSDGRFEQARPIARLDRQSSVTTALGYQAQAHRNLFGAHQLLVGGEAYHESIDAERQLIEPSGAIVGSRPDIPGGTSYKSYGLFAQQSADLIPDRLTVRGGFRVSGFNFATTPDAALGVTNEDVTMHAMTFETSAVVRATDFLNVTANVNRAFRAPNASDFGAIGLTGGGGFEIAPSTAASMNAIVGSTGAADARSTGVRVSGLAAEVVYQYEVGVKVRGGRFSGAVNGFNLELHDFIQRRSLVFDGNVVGTTISGFQITRQDANGLAYVAQDVRPIATRINVDRARIRGFDAVGEMQLTSSWNASGHFSLANGTLSDGQYIRRMPPAMGTARIGWSRAQLWAEGVLTFALEQTRLNSGDLSDARIGALRTRTSIATFFNGTATDLELVRDGVLVPTGETLAQVQARILGTAASAPLYTAHPGFAVVGVRGGIRVSPQFDVIVIGENLGDVNYRLYGSGLDAPGINLQVRTRYRF